MAKVWKSYLRGSQEMKLSRNTAVARRDIFLIGKQRTQAPSSIGEYHEMKDSDTHDHGRGNFYVRLFFFEMRSSDF
jgi:hypothetical protein